MKSVLSIFASTIVLSFGLSNFAVGHPGHLVGACKEDVKKYCGDIKHGDHAAMMTCIKTNEANFSEGCKAEYSQMKKHVDAMLTACKTDMETLCKDVSISDHKGMHECMMKNSSKLSDSCKAERAKMMKKGKHHHESET